MILPPTNDQLKQDYDERWKMASLHDDCKKRIAALESALHELEKWSNSHLGWSASLEYYIKGVYKEIAKVGQIARKAMEASDV